MVQQHGPMSQDATCTDAPAQGTAADGSLRVVLADDHGGYRIGLARAISGHGRLAHLGVRLDPARNEALDGDGLVGDGVAVVAAREDLEVARQVEELLGS